LINSLIDLPELPFFISGDNFGNVVLWSTSPILDKYMSFHIFKLKFVEIDAQGQESEVISVITSFKWN